jgi:hypothetical protein
VGKQRRQAGDVNTQNVEREKKTTTIKKVSLALSLKPKLLRIGNPTAVPAGEWR